MAIGCYSLAAWITNCRLRVERRYPRNNNTDVDIVVDTVDVVNQWINKNRRTGKLTFGFCNMCLKCPVNQSIPIRKLLSKSVRNSLSFDLYNSSFTTVLYACNLSAVYSCNASSPKQIHRMSPFLSSVPATYFLTPYAAYVPTLPSFIFRKPRIDYGQRGVLHVFQNDFKTFWLQCVQTSGTFNIGNMQNINVITMCVWAGGEGVS